MPSLRDFEHFYAYGDDVIAAAMTTGLVVPDTNVLLNLYRFQATARDELFGALEKLSDRLWIPHQVGHEFHRNRLEVIAQQEQFFRDTRGEVDSSIAALRRKVRAFQTRIALSKDDLLEIDDSIGALQKLITGEVAKAEKANEVRLKDRDSDTVLARLEKLFEDRVGSPMESKELEEAHAEADRRIRHRIPPGYKDADKDTGDPAGDYLIWRQLLSEAAKRRIPVVLISDDEKEDWIRREHNVPLGARQELREEMTREAGVPLLIMTTEIFLRHAKAHLDATVSEETVDQAKELPSVPDIIYPSTELLDSKWGQVALRILPSSSQDALFPRLTNVDGEHRMRALASLLASSAESSRDERVRRSVFERALLVPPREARDVLKEYVLEYAASDRATHSEVARAEAWLQEAIDDAPDHYVEHEASEDV
jgi:hypothetical protein